MAKAAAKTGARVETDPSIKPARPRLDDLQNVETPPRFFLAALRVRLQLVSLEFVRFVLVRAFFLREIIEELPDAGILRALGGFFVEAASFLFHRAGLRTDRFEP